MVLAGTIKLRSRPLPRIQRLQDTPIGETFVPFSKLIPELKLMIWRLALPSGRELSMGGWRHSLSTDVEFTITATKQLPFGMQAACRESREVFLKHYKAVHKNLISRPEHQTSQSQRFRPLYIDFEADIIALTDFSYGKNIYHMLDSFGDWRLIQRLAIDVRFLRTWRKQDTLNQIQLMPALKELTVLVNDRPALHVLPLAHPDEEPANPLAARGIRPFEWDMDGNTWAVSAELEMSDTFSLWWMASLEYASAATLAAERQRFDKDGKWKFPSPGKITIRLGSEWSYDQAEDRWHQTEERERNKYGGRRYWRLHRMRWYLRPSGGHHRAGLGRV